MLEQEPDYFNLTGPVLDDQQVNVRLGVLVLFEEQQLRGCEVSRAIPSLIRLLDSADPQISGAAIRVMAIMASPETYLLLYPLMTDQQPQVAEIAKAVVRQLEIKHNLSPAAEQRLKVPATISQGGAEGGLPRIICRPLHHLAPCEVSTAGSLYPGFY